MPTSTPTPEKLTGLFTIKTDTPVWLHASCVVLASSSALALILPPRRFDFRSLILTAAFSFSTSQLAYDYTGKSMSQRFGARAEKLDSMITGQDTLSERSQEIKRILKEEKLRKMTPEQRKAEEEKEKAGRGILKRLWLGGESEDWKQKRIEEDRKALEEGKGISGIIMDQISEVFGGSDKKNDEKKNE